MTRIVRKARFAPSYFTLLFDVLQPQDGKVSSPFKQFRKFCQIHTFHNAYLPVAFQPLIDADLRGHRRVEIALAVLLAESKDDDKTH